MGFDVIIGLELHIQMKTKSKMFSSAPVSFALTPNTQVHPIDMGFPGTMPSVNKKAVINAIRVAHSLNMEIDDTLLFERKNYFYSDLPKEYQLTQQFRPLGKNGHLFINTSKGIKRIEIERLHIEEDTCKQVHHSDCTLLDFNRAGIPLIEIVSKPDFRSGIEAAKFVEEIKSIVSYLDVSDGKMENGSLRCDVNVSVKEHNKNKLGTKVEIKNLNSISNIEKAIDYEIIRQSNILSSGGVISQETRRFDERKKETVLMRIKTDEVEYRFFTDPNIAPIKLSRAFIEESIATSPELANARLKRYKKIGLNDYDSHLLIAEKDVSNYYDDASKYGVNPKLLANWIIGDVLRVLNKKKISIKDFKVPAKFLAELIRLIEEGKISNKQAREIFLKIVDNPVPPSSLIKTELTNNEDLIKGLVKEVVDLNEQSVMDYKNGKDRALSYIVGQVIKKADERINPSLASKLVLEEIKRR